MEDKWLVGVDLGGTTIKIAFISEDGEMIEKWEIKTDKSGETITSDISKSIEEKLVELGQTKEKLIGIGMGAPGPVNMESGVVYETSNLGWRNYPLKDQLENSTGLKAVIDNDANMAAIGEMWKGAGEGTKDLVFVTLGTGVGGGIISNGEVIRGTNGAGGEFGHVTSVPQGGVKCGCGKNGCLETIASATGIVRLALEAINNSNEKSRLKSQFEKDGEMTSKMVFEAAQNGDKLALEVIDSISFYLGLALANLANAVNPEKIVLGGGVSKAGDVLLNPVKEKFTEYAFPRVEAGAEIIIATLGNDAGVFGGAYLAKTKLSQ